MLTRISLIAVLVAGVSLGQNEPVKAAAGSNAEAKYFHLDFAVKELEGGKTVNSRSYSMTVSTSRGSLVRSGNRIPVVTQAANPQPNNPQYTYVDVGTNIDCSDAHEVQGRLALSVTVDISASVNAPDAPAPVIRQVKWSSPALVPLRKPTVIFLSDDPSSKRQMELELTASPMD